VNDWQAKKRGVLASVESGLRGSSLCQRLLIIERQGRAQAVRMKRLKVVLGKLYRTNFSACEGVP